jgi:hypothetical protein
VPEGCLANLSGEWVHAADPTYRYLAHDDGGTLTLEVRRVEPPDAGFHPRRFRDAGLPRSDAGSSREAVADAVDEGVGRPRIAVVLTRTAKGFVGETRLAVRHPLGRDCEAVFPAEVLDCRNGALVISAAAAVTLDAACQPPAAPTGPALRNTLRRLPSP